LAGALIVIELAAPSVSDDALAVLVSSCTRAARDAECVLAKDASDEQPYAVAIVSQQADDKMRIEVGVRQGEHDSWRTKDFAFLAADLDSDRWRAVGFAIGTLAEDNAPRTAPAAEPPKPPPAPIASVSVAPPLRTAPKPKPSPQLFVGVAVIFGPGLDTGPWRVGSALSANIAPQHAPIFFTFGGSAATRVTTDSNGATARWYDVSSGAGVPLLGSLESSGVELGGRILAEHFDVSVNAPDGTSAERGRWIFGFEGELGGRVQVVPGLFLTAGIIGSGLSSETDVRVAGVPEGNAASFRYLGSFGIRVRLR
jgi:hypothetical protein